MIKEKMNLKHCSVFYETPCSIISSAVGLLAVLTFNLASLKREKDRVYIEYIQTVHCKKLCKFVKRCAKLCNVVENCGKL